MADQKSFLNVPKDLTAIIITLRMHLNTPLAQAVAVWT